MVSTPNDMKSMAGIFTAPDIQIFKDPIGRIQFEQFCSIRFNSGLQRIKGGYRNRRIGCTRTRNQNLPQTIAARLQDNSVRGFRDRNGPQQAGNICNWDFARHCWRIDQNQNS